LPDDDMDTPPLRVNPGDRVLPSGRLRPAGLEEPMISAVVEAFYSKVQVDPLLGPVFNSRIAPEDWPQHIALIKDFWSSMLLGSGRYGGRPMPKHLRLANVVTDAHFERWLGLFKATAEALCEPSIAALFIDRAERIAQSFRLGMAFQRGEDTTNVALIRAR
jgi:hemoglobin